MWKVSMRPWRQLGTRSQSLFTRRSLRTLRGRLGNDVSLLARSSERSTRKLPNDSSKIKHHHIITASCFGIKIFSARNFSAAPMSDGLSSDAIPFILADIGEGIAEVELLQWFVEEGDQVQQFDRICEVQSDKATVEITSRYDGRITSLEHNKGDMIKVGSPLLFLESEDGAAASNLHTASTQSQSMEDDEKLNIPTIASQYHLATDSQDEPEEDASDLVHHAETRENLESRMTQASPSSKVLTSPAIRKLAKEHSLDLSTIVGTGPKGRVLKGDVLTVLKERGLVQPDKVSDSNPMTSATTSSIPRSSLPKQTFEGDDVIVSIEDADLPLQRDTTMEIRGYNRLMVQSMTASLQIPHMVYSDEINVTGLRTQYKSNLPFLPYCVKAASMALSKYPLLNASFDADANRVLLWADHNIGIAMDTPRGLIVPVVKEIQNKSLTDITTELRRLKEAAKDGSVPKEDLQGATFTLSNIGAIGGGGTYMSPIVTSPQVAIGALGQVQRVPRFVSDGSMELYEAYIVNVSWGGDHRVVDGATMARFHTQWKQYLEDPICLIQEMK